jgi:hypothetical protein
MITANELKTKGIKAIEEQLAQTPEAAITVHGKVKYVAMTVEKYDEMRLAELEVAYLQCKKDIEEGNFTIETAEQHIERLWK